MMCSSTRIPAHRRRSSNAGDDLYHARVKRVITWEYGVVATRTDWMFDETQMQRVAIIGNAGGGKSTLARKLGTTQAIPVHEIDLLQWKPGWVRASAEEFGQIHDEWLASPSWIIDGWGVGM